MLSDRKEGRCSAQLGSHDLARDTSLSIAAPMAAYECQYSTTFRVRQTELGFQSNFARGTDLETTRISRYRGGRFGALQWIQLPSKSFRLSDFWMCA
jgi:hypothetical protein